MNTYDLSILIPARNEMFLAQTIKNVLANKRGKTEVVAVLDGAWTNPPIDQHPDVTVIYHHTAVGQRAATNEACRLSTAKYIMKLDAHCAVGEGFDTILLEDMRDDLTMIPALYNLHAFDWKCKICGNQWYQGPEPKFCCKDRDGKERNEKCSNTKHFERVMIWEPRAKRRSEFYRFDTNLHFQYHSVRKKHPEAVGDIVETMSAQGSCFVLTRKKYWDLNICDEEFGSWGQQGVEVACKTWLSGGRLVTNRKTWYAHMFRTQEGFSFSYPISGSQIAKARAYSKSLFIDNTWNGQMRPLIWLIEKFGPLNNESKDNVPDWHSPKGEQVLNWVKKRGEEFEEKKKSNMKDMPDDTLVTKGIIYYTDNQLSFKLAHKCRKQLLKANLPITSVSLKPMSFGTNYVLPLKRGYEAYFRQILLALEKSIEDVIFFGEHDWLYHPSHFDFMPKRKDAFYYNWNWWRVRASDGLAVHYDTQLVPGLVAYRETLVDYYKQVVSYLEHEGFNSDTAHRVGFEPGTHSRVPFSKKYHVERFDSEFPILDIRHMTNLTSSKWSPDAFRNPKNASNWKETDDIPGWGKVKGNFGKLLSSI
jgi:glycosyltransferase involved in cell wall biosynthesis